MTTHPDLDAILKWVTELAGDFPPDELAITGVLHEAAEHIVTVVTYAKMLEARILNDGEVNALKSRIAELEESASSLDLAYRTVKFPPTGDKLALQNLSR